MIIKLYSNWKQPREAFKHAVLIRGSGESEATKGNLSHPTQCSWVTDIFKVIYGIPWSGCSWKEETEREN